MPTAGPAEAIARGMKSRRKDVMAQFHIGSYTNFAGVTDRTRDYGESTAESYGSCCTKGLKYTYRSR